MIRLATLHGVAVSKTEAYEATARQEQAILDADLRYAHEHHQAMGDGYWQTLHRARIKARTARMFADALAEILAELGDGN